MKPKIGEQEFAQRQERLQTLMQQQGIDLVIAYSDDRFVYGQAYTRWLFDYRPAFEPACALIPAHGQGVIITGAESEHLVLGFSYCKQVYIVEEFLHPNEEYDYCKPTKMADVIKTLEAQLGKTIETVAVASPGEIPCAIYSMLVSHFDMGNAQLADDMFTQLRKIKTKDELEVLKYAYEIADIGMNAALKTLKEGITEREVAAYAEYRMKMAGAEGTGIELMVSFGKEHTFPVLSHVTDRELSRGDLVVLTIAPRYEGYHGAIARSLIFGGGNEEAERALVYAKKAMENAANKLEAGVLGAEIDAESRRVMAEGGYAKNFAYTGVHSVGVVEFEPPIMASYETTVIERDMVISLDVPAFMTSFGGLRIEHGFLITEKGAQSLSKIPYTVTL